MTVCGVICEYNPFHLGHEKQLRAIRRQLGEDCVIVCLMSGNFVQRGQCAIFDKMTRARAALACGANLVLELPLTAALQSAEGFAFRGTEILTELGADAICFGCECADAEALQRTAAVMERPEFSDALRTALDSGCTYASAQEQALREVAGEAFVPREPNDILGVQYCRALLRLHSPMQVLAVKRPGSYHDAQADAENPSAEALRGLLRSGRDAGGFVPQAAFDVYRAAPMFLPECGERAMLARLRTLSPQDWEKTPFGSEGLWSKAWKTAQTACSTEELVQTLKTKRYIYTRLSRLLLCAYLGIDAEIFAEKPPYVRALGFDQSGRQVLKAARDRGMALVNAGQTPPDAAYYALECRAAALYGLFACKDEDMSLSLEPMQRVIVM